ncbi:myosin heavy chain [Ceratobasidium sp. AG-Ba]|nr:myosin heavy chain [Ceratobasidium sp. AG-Ba]QRW04334.1 myosin heavy chain [Ceratobasidium sp. AG-Ba]
MDLDVGLEHPLAIEILSLRDALSQQQHATQQATAQLQKYAFDALSANNRARQLGAENDALQSEVDILRAPRPTASPSNTEAELTLALRRANSRLEHTEKALQEAEVTALHAHGERERTAGEVAAAYHLLEEARSQVVELRSALASHEHEKKSYETVLSEYAALVRSLEKRASESEVPPVERDGKSTHSSPKLTPSGDTEHIKELTREIARARADLGTLQAQLDVERRVGEEERLKLAQTRAELEKRIADDKSAAALVERYMKFSQHHTDVLQRALADQSTRHEATRTSLLQRIEHLEHALSKESARNIQLRASVDTLVDDLARESAGRRREVRVRLAIAGREAKVEESLRRWERRIREHPKQQTQPDEAAGLFFDLDDLDQFHRIIDNLGAAITFRTTADASNDDSLSGTLSRILAAEIAVEALTAELERETSRRMDLERERARFIGSPTHSPRESIHIKPESQSFSTMPSSAAVSLISCRTTSQDSLAESATTVSVQESPQIAFTLVTEVSKQENLPSSPDAPPKAVTPEAVPVSSSTSVIPFPASSPALPRAQELTQPISLHEDPTIQKLLARLPTALKRYESFQATFRDCHLTLSALKTELRQKPRSYLLTAVERLDDYNEDARVEVEIRIADEARTANGLEAMLHLGQTEAVSQLQSLVDGTAPDVQKAFATATRKRDDLEHDIAAVKLVVHAPQEEPEHNSLLSPNPVAEPVSPGSQSWGWKRPFRQSIPTQPASPLGIAFPFPQQTIRRMGSGTMGHNRGSSFGGNDAKEHTHTDPFAAMGLRIPMPAYQPPPQATPTTSFPSSPLRPSHMSASPLVLERPRTTSMYHVGIGRSPSGLDASKRLSMTPRSKTPTEDAGEESDDSVE